MLSKRQISEIREHLERAQNPLFYYDNDADGLCSFALLRRFIDRGKGVSVRSFPDLGAPYARKVSELNADYVFVLDKPTLTKEFVEEIDTLGLPLIWIDHHDLEPESWEKDFKNVIIYNPTRNKGKDKSDEPVTYLSYEIVGKREEMWIAMMGCIADHHLPDFYQEFSERFKEYWGTGIKGPFDAYYGTEIGRMAQSLNFGLKDSISNVVRLQNFLISVSNPGEFFLESSGNYSFRKKIGEVRKKYDELLVKAKNSIDGNLIFFDYSGDLSISAEISNKLSHLYHGKYIVVGYRNGGVSNMSLRGKGVKGILSEVLKKVDGSGGGHEDAVGARIATGDLGKFKEAVKDEIS
jgi:single-stranded DNA-specific DHH superfamily exonuclease